ncbi:NADPH-dependent 1-acyldihydroxyacetone phosphate [Cyphellophora attinorum]|uniref:NADPH-dependent 1-acyldihydroxyacetone phosphate n=1 Tax=Cyphellophora attinorum TaxID=1664694 RepID=A0A0N0NLZ1_9EURO|nr:NADPH-dependent 1-acyldihydroxyacetone phosphate [Phialophora attinorum]KPI39599.1 NADPH-dependent 1-acyldihydroxyacetone phosphate [Phialophora attinorum]
MTRTVLLTGCSDGSLGSALALAFHKAGLKVYATARNPQKLTKMEEAGIETKILDVLDSASIAACVSAIPQLDILFNNAGGGYSTPYADIDIAKAKELFDLNTWSYVAVTQAFLPLLLESKGIVVNNTSVVSAGNMPFGSAYNASKAATAMFSDTARLELEPFGVRVIDLKTASTASNFAQTHMAPAKVKESSIYYPARVPVEKAMRSVADDTHLLGAADKYAEQVVKGVMKPAPSKTLWLGKGASVVHIMQHLPWWATDYVWRQIAQMSLVRRDLAGKQK